MSTHWPSVRFELHKQLHLAPFLSCLLASCCLLTYSVVVVGHAKFEGGGLDTKLVLACGRESGKFSVYEIESTAKIAMF
eukprot:COSAG01_NODE_57165_length_314_cov_0.674419_1_plen_78_part_10